VADHYEENIASIASRRAIIEAEMKLAT